MNFMKKTRALGAAGLTLTLLWQMGCRSDRWGTFSDDQIGFTMQWQPSWPKKWIQEENKKHLVFSLSENKQEQAALGVIKRPDKFPIELTLSSSADLFKPNYQKQIITIAGRRAAYMEGFLKGSDARMALFQWNGDQANYALQCYVQPASAWKKYQGKFTKAVGSFRLTAEPKPLVIGLWKGPADLTAAKAAYERKDYGPALAQLKALADKNNADAQVLMGKAYAEGRGVEQNFQQAVAWFKKAAENGSPDGQAALGSFYLMGIDVQKNPQKAMEWLLKAAKQGSGNAMDNLGLMYVQGQGVPKDFKQGVAWFHKAADKGYPGAYFPLGKMYAEGIGVKKDPAEAYYWFCLARRANGGHGNPLIEQVERSLPPQKVKEIQARAAQHR
jgi:hypothetical protein